MAEQTPNLNLKKPAYGESADVKDFNDNMDTIDGAVKNILDSIGTLPSGETVQDQIDAVNARLPDDNGDQYDVLRSNGDGTSEWVAYGLPTDEQTATAVSDWLDDHPEATTTVQDGAITRAKLDADLKEKTDAVPDLKSALDHGEESIENGTEKVKQEAMKVKAVDTTAAGDTFTGYFVAGLMKGDPLKTCMEEATKASAISVTRPGAADSIPWRKEIEGYLKQM